MSQYFIHAQTRQITLSEGAVNFLAEVELTKRIAKNIAKASQLLDATLTQEAHVHASSTLPMTTLRNATNPGGTVITTEVLGAGAYRDHDLSNDIKKYAKDILLLVKTGNFDKTREDRERIRILQITTLMYGEEVHRNGATFITNQMFLERVLREDRIEMAWYPMAPNGAVDWVRTIQHDNREFLPHSRIIDIKEPTKGAVGADKILQSEGELLIYYTALHSRTELLFLHNELKAIGRGKLFDGDLSVEEYKLQVEALHNIFCKNILIF